MQKIIVDHNQNIFDIAIMLSGCISAAYDIADENNISINDGLVVGMELKYSGEIANKEVYEYIKKNKIIIATGGSNDNF